MQLWTRAPFRPGGRTAAHRDGSRRNAIAASLLIVAGLFSGPAPTSAANPTSHANQGPMLRADGTTQVIEASPPSGFQDVVVFSGLTQPTTVKFSPDGRVFVAEKSGIIKVFSSLTDSSPSTFIDLRSQVHDFWDRGLLGFALDPGFPDTPVAYALYAYNALPGGDAPQWPSQGCPSNPGATSDGCVITARLDRLSVSGNSASIDAHLITDWCDQFPSHTIGDIMFGRDGSLYVSGGDGAAFHSNDYGQWGGAKSPVVTPANPCSDPPGDFGSPLSPPSAEGGTLRSQDVIVGNDPVSLDGSILRVDTNGNGVASNPLAGSSDENARRIIATGFRNPFRFTIRPGTDEVWVGDVGWDTWEEIDRVVQGGLRNFGWPCYEGSGIMNAYGDLNLDACESLYQSGDVVDPYFTYQHGQPIVSGDTNSCSAGGSSISGLAFYGSGNYPSQYHGALFFGDYTRNCIWVMPKLSNGLPDKSRRALFASQANGIVDLVTGPGGDLFWVDLNGGAVHRIRYLSSNHAPTARFTLSHSSGPVPLFVSFNGSSSSDPDRDALKYDWDLDGDGSYELVDAGPTQSTTYDSAGVRHVHLRVRDPMGAESTVTHTVTVGNTSPPYVVIDTPSTSLHWSVGQTITFKGHATDKQDGGLSADHLTWRLELLHCPIKCHVHPLTTFEGVSGGSFVTPDHDYPSSLRLTLTATDSTGARTSVTRVLTPSTVVLTFRTGPTGGKIAVDAKGARSTPFNLRVIRNSAHTISVTSPQTIARGSRAFVGWSDRGARTHTITATSTRTFTAWFRGGDKARPTITMLRVGGIPGSEAGSLIGTRVRWSATDNGGTGVVRYELQVSSDGGHHWSNVTLSPVTRSSIDFDLRQGPAYRFRLRAVDKVGNVSAWTTTQVVRVSAAQESSATTAYHGSWEAVADPAAWSGGLRRADAWGESMTYHFTGRAIAWVAPRGSTRGLVRVYIDGAFKATIDLGAGDGNRLVVYTTDFGGSGPHTLRVANLGTSGRPFADHDAVIVWR